MLGSLDIETRVSPDHLEENSDKDAEFALFSGGTVPISKYLIDTDPSVKSGSTIEWWDKTEQVIECPVKNKHKKRLRKYLEKQPWDTPYNVELLRVYSGKGMGNKYYVFTKPLNNLSWGGKETVLLVLSLKRKESAAVADFNGKEMTGYKVFDNSTQGELEELLRQSHCCRFIGC